MNSESLDKPGVRHEFKCIYDDLKNYIARHYELQIILYIKLFLKLMTICMSFILVYKGIFHESVDIAALSFGTLMFGILNFTETLIVVKAIGDDFIRVFEKFNFIFESLSQWLWSKKQTNRKEVQLSKNRCEVSNENVLVENSSLEGSTSSFDKELSEEDRNYIKEQFRFFVDFSCLTVCDAVKLFSSLICLFKIMDYRLNDSSEIVFFLSTIFAGQVIEYVYLIRKKKLFADENLKLIEDLGKYCSQFNTNCHITGTVDSDDHIEISVNGNGTLEDDQQNETGFKNEEENKKIDDTGEQLFSEKGKTKFSDSKQMYLSKEEEEKKMNYPEAFLDSRSRPESKENVNNEKSEGTQEHVFLSGAVSDRYENIDSNEVLLEEMNENEVREKLDVSNSKLAQEENKKGKDSEGTQEQEIVSRADFDSDEVVAKEIKENGERKFDILNRKSVQQRNVKVSKDTQEQKILLTTYSDSDYFYSNEIALKKIKENKERSELDVSNRKSGLEVNEKSKVSEGILQEQEFFPRENSHVDFDSNTIILKEIKEKEHISNCKLEQEENIRNIDSEGTMKKEIFSRADIELEKDYDSNQVVQEKVKENKEKEELDASNRKSVLKGNGKGKKFEGKPESEISPTADTHEEFNSYEWVSKEIKRNENGQGLDISNTKAILEGNVNEANSESAQEQENFPTEDSHSDEGFDSDEFASNEIKENEDREERDVSNRKSVVERNVKGKDLEGIQEPEILTTADSHSYKDFNLKEFESKEMRENEGSRVLDVLNRKSALNGNVKDTDSEGSQEQENVSTADSHSDKDFDSNDFVPNEIKENKEREELDVSKRKSVLDRNRKGDSEGAVEQEFVPTADSDLHDDFESKDIESKEVYENEERQKLDVSDRKAPQEENVKDKDSEGSQKQEIFMNVDSDADENFSLQEEELKEGNKIEETDNLAILKKKLVLEGNVKSDSEGTLEQEIVPTEDSEFHDDFGSKDVSKEVNEKEERQEHDFSNRKTLQEENVKDKDTEGSQEQENFRNIYCDTDVNFSLKDVKEGNKIEERDDLEILKRILVLEGNVTRDYEGTLEQEIVQTADSELHDDFESKDVSKEVNEKEERQEHDFSNRKTLQEENVKDKDIEGSQEQENFRNIYCDADMNFSLKKVKEGNEIEERDDLEILKRKLVLEGNVTGYYESTLEQEVVLTADSDLYDDFELKDVSKEVNENEETQKLDVSNIKALQEENVKDKDTEGSQKKENFRYVYCDANVNFSSKEVVLKEGNEIEERDDFGILKRKLELEGNVKGDSEGTLEQEIVPTAGSDLHDDSDLKDVSKEVNENEERQELDVLNRKALQEENVKDKDTEGSPERENFRSIYSDADVNFSVKEVKESIETEERDDLGVLKRKLVLEGNVKSDFEGILAQEIVPTANSDLHDDFDSKDVSKEVNENEERQELDVSNRKALQEEIVKDKDTEGSQKQENFRNVYRDADVNFSLKEVVLKESNEIGERDDLGILKRKLVLEGNVKSDFEGILEQEIVPTANCDLQDDFDSKDVSKEVNENEEKQELDVSNRKALQAENVKDKDTEGGQKHDKFKNVDSDVDVNFSSKEMVQKESNETEDRDDLGVLNMTLVQDGNGKCKGFEMNQEQYSSETVEIKNSVDSNKTILSKGIKPDRKSVSKEQLLTEVKSCIDSSSEISSKHGNNRISKSLKNNDSSTSSALHKCNASMVKADGYSRYFKRGNNTEDNQKNYSSDTMKEEFQRTLSNYSESSSSICASSGSFDMSICSKEDNESTTPFRNAEYSRHPHVVYGANNSLNNTFQNPIKNEENSKHFTDSLHISNDSCATCTINTNLLDENLDDISKMSLKSPEKRKNEPVCNLLLRDRKAVVSRGRTSNKIALNQGSFQFSCDITPTSNIAFDYSYSFNSAEHRKGICKFNLKKLTVKDGKMHRTNIRR